MGNSRVLNTMVPSNTCRNDVYMVILVPEEIRVEYAIAYLRNKEILHFCTAFYAVCTDLQFFTLRPILTAFYFCIGFL